MDIGTFKNNTTFYEGYEGEKEIILSMATSPEMNLHIWDGYFEDIFVSPIAHKNGWEGFTRDYQKGLHVFGCTDVAVTIKPHEYLQDLRQYRFSSFGYKETATVVSLLIDFLELAVKIGSDVAVVNS